MRKNVIRLKILRITDDSIAFGKVSVNKYGRRPVYVTASVNQKLMEKVRQRGFTVGEVVNVRLKKATEGCGESTAIDIER